MPDVFCWGEAPNKPISRAKLLRISSLMHERVGSESNRVAASKPKRKKVFKDRRPLDKS